ncbi:MAG: lipocalin family protein [Pseudomonas sp.]|nr:lipocalin family protein [Pseudomonas sp.]
MEGTAYFVEDQQTSYLKVPFFGSFYSAYITFDLGQSYEYSLVASTDKPYIWLLSHTPTLPVE